MIARAFTVALALLVAAGVDGGVAEARRRHAPDGETRAATLLRKRPSSAAKVIAKLPAGEKLLVEKRAGLWSLVSVGKKRGWVPTDQIAKIEKIAPPAPTLPKEEVVEAPLPAAATEKPNPPAAPGAPLAAPRVRTEAWVTDSQYHRSDEADVLVLERAARLYGRPTEKAPTVGMVERGERVHRLRISNDNQWFMVELGAGEVGWIEAGAVHGPPRNTRPTLVAPASQHGEALARRDAVATPATLASRDETPSTSAAGAPEGTAVVSITPPGKTVGLALSASGGWGRIDRRFTSNGTAPLSNYSFDVDGGAVTVAGGYRGRLGSLLFWGASADYTYAGGGAFRYALGDGTTTTLSVQSHTADADLALGLRSTWLGGVALSLLVGGRLTATLVQPSPQLQIPSDRVLAMTVGLAFDAPALFPLGAHPIGLHAHALFLPVGSRSENVSDGSDQGTWGADFGGALTLPLWTGQSSELDLGLSYAYRFEVSHLAGASARDGSVSVANFGSAQHTAAIGLAFLR